MIGTYMVEQYQFLEQMTKHLWAEGTVGRSIMLNTLAYLGGPNGYDCYPLGYSITDGSTLVYGALAPGSTGTATMGIYSTMYCVTLTEDHGTWDDYVIDNGGEGEGVHGYIFPNGEEVIEGERRLRAAR